MKEAKSPGSKVSSFLVKSNSLQVGTYEGHGTNIKINYSSPFGQSEQQDSFSTQECPTYGLLLGRAGLGAQLWALGSLTPARFSFSPRNTRLLRASHTRKDYHGHSSKSKSPFPEAKLVTKIVS